MATKVIKQVEESAPKAQVAPERKPPPPPPPPRQAIDIKPPLRLGDLVTVFDRSLVHPEIPRLGMINGFTEVHRRVHVTVFMHAQHDSGHAATTSRYNIPYVENPLIPGGVPRSMAWCGPVDDWIPGAVEPVDPAADLPVKLEA